MRVYVEETESKRANEVRCPGPSFIGTGSITFSICPY
jgi:hypothetical protein